MIPRLLGWQLKWFLLLPPEKSYCFVGKREFKARCPLAVWLWMLDTSLPRWDWERNRNRNVLPRRGCRPGQMQSWCLWMLSNLTPNSELGPYLSRTVEIVVTLSLK